MRRPTWPTRVILEPQPSLHLISCQTLNCRDEIVLTGPTIQLFQILPHAEMCKYTSLASWLLNTLAASKMHLPRQCGARPEKLMTLLVYYFENHNQQLTQGTLISCAVVIPISEALKSSRNSSSSNTGYSGIDIQTHILTDPHWSLGIRAFWRPMTGKENPFP